MKKIQKVSGDILLSTQVYGLYHPKNYHSFTPTNYVFLPMKCHICNETVFPFISACLCLRCRCFVHRKCCGKKSKCDFFTFKNIKSSTINNSTNIQNNVSINNIHDVESVIEKAINIPKMLNFLPNPGSEYCIWRSILRAIARHHIVNSKTIPNIPDNSTESEVNKIVSDILSDGNSFPGQVALAVHTVFLQLDFHQQKHEISNNTTSNSYGSSRNSSGNKSVENSEKYQHEKLNKTIGITTNNNYAFDSSGTISVSNSNNNSTNNSEKLHVSPHSHIIDTEAALLHLREAFDTVIFALLSIIVDSTNLQNNAALCSFIVNSIEKYLLCLNFDILYFKVKQHFLLSGVKMKLSSTIQYLLDTRLSNRNTNIYSNSNYDTMHSDIYNSNSGNVSSSVNNSVLLPMLNIMPDVVPIIDTIENQRNSTTNMSTDDNNNNNISNNNNNNNSYTSETINTSDDIVRTLVHPESPDFQSKVDLFLPLLSYYNDSRLLLLDYFAAQITTETLAMHKLQIIVQLLQQISVVFSQQKIEWSEYVEEEEIDGESDENAEEFSNGVDDGTDKHSNSNSCDNISDILHSTRPQTYSRDYSRLHQIDKIHMYLYELNKNIVEMTDKNIVRKYVTPLLHSVGIHNDNHNHSIDNNSNINNNHSIINSTTLSLVAPTEIGSSVTAGGAAMTSPTVKYSAIYSENNVDDIYHSDHNNGNTVTKVAQPAAVEPQILSPLSPLVDYSAIYSHNDNDIHCNMHTDKPPDTLESNAVHNNAERAISTVANSTTNSNAFNNIATGNVTNSKNSNINSRHNTAVVTSSKINQLRDSGDSTTTDNNNNNNDTAAVTTTRNDHIDIVTDELHFAEPVYFSSSTELHEPNQHKTTTTTSNKPSSPNNRNKVKTLETDELINIFCSLIIHQHTHGKVNWFVEYKYITSSLLRERDSLLGVEGYALATFEQCIHCITNE